MLHRFREDTRALVWAFVLFPLPPTLALLNPDLALWLLPVALYLAFCSGVLAHNHNHCPVFHDRRANLAYAGWLSIFYGFPTFAWVPTHNQNHHRYLNGEGDATRTTRHSRSNSLLAAVTYPLRSSAWQFQVISRYLTQSKARRRKRLLRMAAESALLISAQAGFLCLAMLLHGATTGVFVYAVAAGIPAAFAPWSVMFINYVQHVDCDPASIDDHSRNFVSVWANYLTFDNGYHTVHHEHPGVHWSRYRALHQARASKIDPALNQNSIFEYCAKTYLVAPLAGALRRAAAPASTAHLP
jgi:fatty acid desaturase